MPCISITIEADHVTGPMIAGEHPENDLQEMEGEVFTGLRIDHLEIFVPEHQLFVDQSVMYELVRCHVQPAFGYF